MHPKSNAITPKLHRAGFIQKAFFALKVASFFLPLHFKVKNPNQTKSRCKRIIFPSKFLV